MLFFIHFLVSSGYPMIFPFAPHFNMVHLLILFPKYCVPVNAGNIPMMFFKSRSTPLLGIYQNHFLGYSSPSLVMKIVYLHLYYDTMLPYMNVVCRISLFVSMPAIYDTSCIHMYIYIYTCLKPCVHIYIYIFYMYAYRHT